MDVDSGWNKVQLLLPKSNTQLLGFRQQMIAESNQLHQPHYWSVQSSWHPAE
jgi:hypothetical protein